MDSCRTSIKWNQRVYDVHVSTIEVQLKIHVLTGNHTIQSIHALGSVNIKQFESKSDSLTISISSHIDSVDDVMSTDDDLIKLSTICGDNSYEWFINAKRLYIKGENNTAMSISNSLEGV